VLGLVNGWFQVCFQVSFQDGFLGGFGAARIPVLMRA
jgi:hypothetical protein